ncbi:bromodomain-containing protein 8 isoform X4 [Pygocentrus nattereri]|uniref:bromodomain-containing protein 8 isoform X4 n=1 Tax=Pygocentrus nattereri TaxID=42514 RepID=UPI000814A0E9|nr:bromodomain-containing protein 8 isoform X4 [Pygocentrus nattereri]
MASGVGKHKLLLGPTEPWSIREKLCLASSVMKSGDQNWVSVSRAIKPFAEPGRPPDWFSQKHCASQYSELLESTEAPKRKRGEKGEVVETVEDVIVRRLTAERIEELKKLIKETQEKHRKLKREAELIHAGHLDSKLEELWGDIVQSRKQEEEEAEVKRKATDAAYQARQAVRNTPKRLSGLTMRSPSGAASPGLDFTLGDSCEELGMAGAGSAVFTPVAELPGAGMVEGGLSALLEDCTGQKKLLVQKATPPPSPLLSELLKKGSLLPTSPRLVADGESGQIAGIQEPQLTASALPASQAVTAGEDDGHSVESKASVLEEEDLVTVSYMADELDLETVGDIIAIIEDKGDENAEALDAAAVEAALSLCEDTDHALSGHWESSSFKSVGSEPSNTADSLVIPSMQPALEGRREGVGVRHEPCGSSEGCGQGYQLPSSPCCTSGELEHTQMPGVHSETDPEPEHTYKEVGQHISPSATAKSEKAEWPQSQIESHMDSDVAARQHSKLEMKEEEDDEDEGVSDAEDSSVLEIKAGLAGECGGDEDGEGVEGYLSEAEGEAELEPPASESEDGCSMHTASSSLQLHTTADSIPSSPASSQFSISSEDQEAIQAQKIWKKAIMLVWRAAANHRYANVFLQPVTDDIAPGYHSIVHRPMDLSTIKKNIENGLIRTTAEFQRDIMLMFQNAVMYNSSDHDVFHMAVEMQRDVLEQIQQFLATQLIMQTSESGISAKSLRGREANRKQDPNDKDSVPMASPAFLLSLFDGGTRGRRCAIEADLKMKK